MSPPFAGGNADGRYGSADAKAAARLINASPVGQRYEAQAHMIAIGLSLVAVRSVVDRTAPPILLRYAGDAERWLSEVGK